MRLFNERLFAAVLLSAVAFAGADEDFRKLLDLKPPFIGPVWVQGDGMARGGGFPAVGVSLLSWIPLNNFAGNHSSGNDCWGYVSPSGREYAIMGLEKGFGVVEITNPTAPVIVASIPGPTSLWHDVKVIGTYAYGVSEGGAGVQVMDLSDIDNGNVTLVRNQQTGGHSSTHNIVSNPDAGTLYLVGANIGNGGLVNLDLTDPTRPTVANGWTEMYVHDACVVTYDSGPYAGREIAFCASGFNGGWNSTGLRIVDVTDKTNMHTVSTFFYTNPAYSHQLWLTEDKHYAFLNDELDEQDGLVPVTTTRIIDVSDINNPVLMGTFTSGSTSIDHNLYVRDQYIFESNYTSGLRVFDASDPLAPVQIAYFDTTPAHDDAVFTGTWSCWPYFPSGTVILSDITQGLFILGIDAINSDRLDVALVGSPPETLNPGGGTEIRALVTPHGDAAIGQVEMILSDAQGGDFTVPGTEETPGLFVFSTPPLPCAADASYYIEADSDLGEAFFAPVGAPAMTYHAIVASGQDTPFGDDFQTDQAWTTASNAADGQWARGVPAGDGSRGDPGADYDGSGSCYLTDNAAGNSDVDEGTVTLTSPVMDATGAASFINYARWYSNTAGADPQNDIFVVEVSNDGGSSWTNLETVGPAGPDVFGGWVYRSFPINDIFPTPSDRFQIRFLTSDLGSGSVVEAAIDAVSLIRYECDEPGCAADRNNDGAADFFDVQDFLSDFAVRDPSADMNNDTVFDFFDVQAFLQIVAAGCP